MSFWRHEEIYRSDVGLGKAGNGNGRRRSPRSSAAMSFPSAIPRQVALQAEPASALPTGNDSQQPMLPYNDFAANGNYPLNSVSQPKGALQYGPRAPPSLELSDVALVLSGGSRCHAKCSAGLRVEKDAGAPRVPGLACQRA